MKEQKIDNKTAAMLAIAADDATEATDCISDERLAAFLDQRLGDDERASVIVHLNQCSDCLHRSAEVSVAISEKREARPVKRWAMLAAASILLICLSIPLMKLMEKPSYIENGYAQVSGVISEKNQTDKGTPALPWESRANTYGFNPGKNLSNPGKAFLSGMFSGKKRLWPNSVTFPEFLKSEKKSIDSLWAETPWHVNYKLGEWCYLMKVISENQLEMDKAFAEKQADYLSGVITGIETQAISADEARLKLALMRIKALQHYFKTASKNSGLTKWGRLERETDILVHLMSL